MMNKKYVNIYSTEQGIEILLDSQSQHRLSLPQSLAKVPFLFSTKLQNREGMEIFLNLVEEKFSSSSIWCSLSATQKLPTSDQAIICEALGKLWPLFRSEKLNDTLTHSNEWLPQMADLAESVCFYGGSFNPWHLGHEQCLRLCPEKNIMVILDTNPLKNLRGEEEYFNEYGFIKEKLDKLALEVNKNLMTYPGFFGSTQGNPTVSWLPNLPVKEKKLLIGDDNFMSIKKWKDYEQLLKSLTVLYIVPRLSREEELETQKSHLKALFPHLEIKILPSHQYQGLSSSKIRSQIKQN